jgi:hypothetical protein
MKLKLLLIAVIFCPTQIFAQTNLKITDLELPNAPAFTILDYSPTNISTPTTTQAFTLSLISAVSDADGFPTNYALEFTPYWVFKNKSRNFTDYLGDEEKDYYSKPYKNMSFSLSSVKKDSIQNISAGIRTNLFTVNRKARRDAINDLINNKLPYITEIIDNTTSPLKDPYPSGSEKSKNWQKTQLDILENNPEYISTSKLIYDKVDEINAMKPIFTIDIASAYSQFYDNNDFKSGNFGRFGAWATFNENIKIKGENNYLCFYQYARYLIDETDYDITTLSYLKENSLDIGLKIEFQFNDFSAGYEYIKRTSESDNYRSVGNLKYKISDSITINGGFGKNFEKTDNLVSFLGISLGIANNNNVLVK